MSKYFINSDDQGYEVFDTIEERDARGKELIEEHLDCDDGWDGSVENITAGVVTHTTKRVNESSPVGVVDEDGFDECGDDFGDFEYRCNYELEKLNE